MTIHPMAEQPRAAAKARPRLRGFVAGLCAIAAIAGLAAIAFALGPYGGATLNEAPETTGFAIRAPTIVPIDEAVSSK